MIINFMLFWIRECLFFCGCKRRKKITFLELSVVATSKSRSTLIAEKYTAKLEAILGHCISLKCLLRWKTLGEYFLFIGADSE